MMLELAIANACPSIGHMSVIVRSESGRGVTHQPASLHVAGATSDAATSGVALSAVVASGNVLAPASTDGSPVPVSSPPEAAQATAAHSATDTPAMRKNAVLMTCLRAKG